MIWIFNGFLAEKADQDETTLSHRQKQRLVKRVKKQEEKKIKMSGYGRNKNKNQPPKKAYNSESEEEQSESGPEEEQEIDSEQESESGAAANNGFTDDNSEWLKPKAKKSTKPDSDDEDMEDEEEFQDEEIDDEEEEDSDDGNLKVRFEQLQFVLTEHNAIAYLPKGNLCG